MLRVVALGLFSLFYTFLPAQKVDTLYQWGVVPEEDLKMTVYEPDTTADAVVLFDIGYLSADINIMGFSSNFIRHKRIKILKKSAFSTEGNVSIRHTDNLFALKAQTILPDGTKKELGEKELFDIKKTAKRHVKKFAFPDLQEGCIIEYTYTLPFDNHPLTLRDWYFQEDIPVRRSELYFNIGNMLTYNYYFQGSNCKTDRLTEGVIKLGQYQVIDSTYPRLYRDTVPAMKEEAYITTMDDYLNRVRFQLSSIKDYYGKTNKILDSWKDIEKNFLKHPLLGLQYSKKGRYNKVWKAVKKELNDTMSVENKVKTIYTYISKNVDWIDDDFNIFSSYDINTAFKNKKANSGELNLMLVACLNKIGIKANPLLVSTRDNGAPIEKYPLATQFNHLLCYTELNGQPLLLDAGSAFRPMGVVRVPSLNDRGWILEKNNSRWINITPSLSSNTTVGSFTLLNDGSLKGTIASSHHGYSAYSERTDVKEDINDEKLKKKLESDFNNIAIDSIVHINLDNISESYRRKIYCTIPNVAIVGDGLIYLKPTLKTDFDESPFKSQKRDFPVDIPFPLKDQYVLNLNIPDEYEIEEMPQPINLALDNKAGIFQYLSTQKDNSIQLLVRIQINQLHFEPSAYPAIKKFFDSIVAKQAEQIVLRKKKVVKNN